MSSETAHTSLAPNPPTYEQSYCSKVLKNRCLQITLLVVGTLTVLFGNFYFTDLSQILMMAGGSVLILSGMLSVAFAYFSKPKTSSQPATQPTDRTNPSQPVSTRTSTQPSGTGPSNASSTPPPSTTQPNGLNPPPSSAASGSSTAKAPSGAPPSAHSNGTSSGASSTSTQPNGLNPPPSSAASGSSTAKASSGAPPSAHSNGTSSGASSSSTQPNGLNPPPSSAASGSSTAKAPSGAPPSAQPNGTSSGASSSSTQPNGLNQPSSSTSVAPSVPTRTPAPPSGTTKPDGMGRIPVGRSAPPPATTQVNGKTVVAQWDWHGSMLQPGEYFIFNCLRFLERDYRAFHVAVKLKDSTVLNSVLKAVKGLIKTYEDEDQNNPFTLSKSLINELVLTFCLDEKDRSKAAKAKKDLLAILQQNGCQMKTDIQPSVTCTWKSHPSSESQLIISLPRSNSLNS